MHTFRFPVTFTATAAGVDVELGSPAAWSARGLPSSTAAERALFVELQRWRVRAAARGGWLRRSHADGPLVLVQLPDGSARPRGAIEDGPTSAPWGPRPPDHHR